MKKKKKKKVVLSISFCPKKRALGGSGDIGVVYIIGALHPELLPKKVLSRTAIF